MRLRALRRRRGWRALFRALKISWRVPFLAQVPLVVVFVGLTVAFAITLFGVLQLREQSDDAIALRSSVLAKTLAARLAGTAVEDRRFVIERAARRSGAEILLLKADGDIVIDASLGAPSKVGLEQLLIVGQGETHTNNGRSRFYSTPLAPPYDYLSLLVLLAAPSHPFGESSMVQLVTLFAILLVALGALAAYGLARSVHTDVTYVKRRITEMAKPDADPAGERVPVRTVDQIGSMTNALNGLIERFAAAEHAYRQDLDGAVEYERERSEFLAALSHELRTPLNAILGFTDVLLAEVDGPLSDDARENLEVVSHSGAHLRRLINDVLDLSALESGHIQLERRDTDVFAIASEVVREVGVTLHDRPLTLELEGEATTAWADPVRIRQVIGNLVSNAVKFTERGTVSVRVRATDDEVTLEVEDTGPGIPESQQARIFELYQQAGDAKSQSVGSGLGLAITRRLVDIHRGRIELRSRTGEGTTFRVFIPRFPPPESLPPPKISGRPGSERAPKSGRSGGAGLEPKEEGAEP